VQILRSPAAIAASLFLSASSFLPLVVLAADELDTVTVTASPLGNGESLATLVESVDRDAVLRRGAASIGDALADVPGVSASGFAAGASRPIIRGFDASRVRVLENGIGSFDVADVGPDHGTPIDPLSAESIEIVRGAGTLRYGSQAIGGVVNTLNDRVPWRRPQDPWAAEASLAAGSVADAREGAGRFDGTLGDVIVHGDAFKRRTQDYSTPLGVQPGSWFDGEGGALGAGYVGDAGHAGLAVVHYGALYGLPNESTYIHMNQNKLLTRAAHDFDGGALKSITFDGGYADYEHRELTPDGVAAATFLDEEWETRTEALFGATGPLSSSALGVQLQRRSYSALGEGADYLLPTLSRNAALFAFAEAPLADLATLQFGLRVEDAKIDGNRGSSAAVSRGFTPVSASVSAVFTPAPALQLGVTLASTARAPAQTELFAQGPHDGPGTFERGNADLHPERSNAFEGTLHWRGGATHVEAAVWGARFQRFIYGAFTGNTCDDAGVCAADDAGDLRELVYGQRDATFRGAELAVDRELGQVAGGKLSARVSGDIVRATLAQGGGDVPRIPPWKVAGGLAWESALVDGEITLRHVASQDNPGALDTPTAGFNSLDAQLALRPTDSDALEIAVVGRNLTNTEQRNAASFNKDEVLMPGRDLRLLVRARF
jgi:iron complex outermembrane receptor protein